MKREISNKYNRVESQKRLYRKRLAVKSPSEVSRVVHSNPLMNMALTQMEDESALKKLEATRVRPGVTSNMRTVVNKPKKKK